MRFACYLLFTIFALCLEMAGASAQTEGPHRTEQLEPYHTHQDTRHGHNRSYPDRGAIVRDVPENATLVNYAGLALRFQDGVWFEPRGPAFMVTAPPIGVIVPALPKFATVLAQKGQTVLYCNDVYYQPRPDLGGFEVVNDPSEPNTTGPPQTGATTEPSQTGAAAEPRAAANTGAASADQATGGPPPPSPATNSAPSSGPALAAATAPAGSPQPTSNPMRTILYPRNGQTSDQQAKDRYDCYRFAVAQTGFDPMKSSAAAQASTQQGDYLRAQGACLDAHGYTVR